MSKVKVDLKEHKVLLIEVADTYKAFIQNIIKKFLLTLSKDQAILVYYKEEDEDDMVTEDDYDREKIKSLKKIFAKIGDKKLLKSRKFMMQNEVEEEIKDVQFDTDPTSFLNSLDGLVKAELKKTYINTNPTEVQNDIDIVEQTSKIDEFADKINKKISKHLEDTNNELEEDLNKITNTLSSCLQVNTKQLNTVIENNIQKKCDDIFKEMVDYSHVNERDFDEKQNFDSDPGDDKEEKINLFCEYVKANIDNVENLVDLGELRSICASVLENNDYNFDTSLTEIRALLG